MWWHILLETAKEATIITSFVFVMMIVVEFLNVFSKGALSKVIRGGNMRQYVVAGVVGAVPGCLGGFTNVTLYCHRLISFGAIVGGMIAASGDEAFIMIAMFPEQALFIFASLLIIGIMTGLLVDILVKRRMFPQPSCYSGLAIHQEEIEAPFSLRLLFQGWTNYLWKRISIILVLISIILISCLEYYVDPEHSFETILLISILSVGVILLAIASSHFLDSHVWGHVIKEHLPRIFFWTLGALLFIELLTNYFHLDHFINESPLIILGAAVLIGLIPQSGPHLLFVTLFARGAIPFSVLLTSCVVQDGHSMLPLLAYSRRDFVYIKIINMTIGLLLGLAGFFMGW